MYVALPSAAAQVYCVRVKSGAAPERETEELLIPVDHSQARPCPAESLAHAIAYSYLFSKCLHALRWRSFALACMQLL
jgi:hypothetical protein